MQSQIDHIKDLNNNSDNDFQFMRRGIVGSHKDELSLELIEKIDQWSAKFLDAAGVTNEELFGL